MGELAEKVLSAVAQDHVGEVVVLVYNQIERITFLVRLEADEIQFPACVRRGFYRLFEPGIVITGIDFGKHVQHLPAIPVEVVFQLLFTPAADQREVEVNHLETVL